MLILLDYPISGKMSFHQLNWELASNSALKLKKSNKDFFKFYFQFTQRKILTTETFFKQNCLYFE